MMPADHHANIYANACEAASEARRAALTAYHAALPPGPLLNREQYIRDTDAIFATYHAAIWAAFDQSKINRQAALDKAHLAGEGIG